MYRLPKAICQEKDCERLLKAHGWCQLHWRRIKATNSPYEVLKCGAKPRHGESRKLTPEYVAWQSMKQRCDYPRHVYYARYGGRGITVCDRWRTYENFLEDVGRRPSKNHTIDRINNDGNYEPSNVRWATRREQKLNNSQTTQITVKGVTKSVTEWAEEIGIQRKTIYQRIRKGWSHEAAIITPKGNYNNG